MITGKLTKTLLPAVNNIESKLNIIKSLELIGFNVDMFDNAIIVHGKNTEQGGLAMIDREEAEGLLKLCSPSTSPLSGETSLIIKYVVDDLLDDIETADLLKVDNIEELPSGEYLVEQISVFGRKVMLLTNLNQKSYFSVYDDSVQKVPDHLAEGLREFPRARDSYFRFKHSAHFGGKEQDWEGESTIYYFSYRGMTYGVRECQGKQHYINSVGEEVKPEQLNGTDKQAFSVILPLITDELRIS